MAQGMLLPVPQGTLDVHRLSAASVRTHPVDAGRARPTFGVVVIGRHDLGPHGSRTLHQAACGAAQPGACEQSAPSQTQRHTGATGCASRSRALRTRRQCGTWSGGGRDRRPPTMVLGPPPCERVRPRRRRVLSVNRGSAPSHEDDGGIHPPRRARRRLEETRPWHSLPACHSGVEEKQKPERTVQMTPMLGGSTPSLGNDLLREWSASFSHRGIGTDWLGPLEAHRRGSHSLWHLKWPMMTARLD